MEAMSAERRKELENTLGKLQALSDTFYAQSIVLGVHAFIEFTGLMNEMIKIYRRSLEEGIDYTLANQHNDTPLVAFPHNVRYLSDKLTCIMEPFAEVRVTLKRDKT